MLPYVSNQVEIVKKNTPPPVCHTVTHTPLLGTYFLYHSEYLRSQFKLKCVQTIMASASVLSQNFYPHLPKLQKMVVKKQTKKVHKSTWQVYSEAAPPQKIKNYAQIDAMLLGLNPSRWANLALKIN